VWLELTAVECYTGGTDSDRWDLEVYVSVIQPSQLILDRERIAVLSQIQTKHMNIVLEEPRSVQY
jgi:predicted HTH domain antitoxin